MMSENTGLKDEILNDEMYIEFSNLIMELDCFQ